MFGWMGLVFEIGISTLRGCLMRMGGMGPIGRFLVMGFVCCL